MSGPKTAPWIRELAFEALRQARTGLTVVRVIVGWVFVLERDDDEWRLTANPLRLPHPQGTIPRQVHLFLRALARGGGASPVTVARLPEQPRERVAMSWRTEST